MIVQRWRRAALGLALALPMACTHESPRDSDSPDDRPILVISRVPDPLDPDKPLVDEYLTYAYEDGSVIWVGLERPNGGQLQFAQSRSQLSAAQVEALRSAIDGAELTGGGTAPPVGSEGMFPDTDDRGAKVYLSRMGDVLTQRYWWSTVFTEDEPGAADLMTLEEALQAGDPHPQPGEAVTEWVLFALGPTQEADPGEWEGPDLTTVEWVEIEGGVDCAIATDTVWPLTEHEYQQNELHHGGLVVQRRPRLPHEHTCVEIAAWRTLVAASA